MKLSNAPLVQPNILHDLMHLFETDSREYNLLNRGSCPHCAGPIHVTRTSNFSGVFLTMGCRQCNISEKVEFSPGMEQWELIQQAEYWIKHFIAQADLRTELEEEEQNG